MSLLLNFVIQKDIKTEDCDAKLEIPSVKVKSSVLLG